MTTERTALPDHQFAVRPFAPADLEPLLALAPRLTEGIAPWRSVEGMLKAARSWIASSVDGIGPERAVLVAEDDRGRPVGFVSVGRETDFTGKPQAYVGELAVAGEAEGAGVGRALMGAAEAWARGCGLRLVVLETGAANARARGFYARLGYVEESVKLAKVVSGAD